MDWRLLVKERIAKIAKLQTFFKGFGHVTYFFLVLFSFFFITLVSVLGMWHFQKHVELP